MHMLMSKQYAIYEDAYASLKLLNDEIELKYKICVFVKFEYIKSATFIYLLNYNSLHTCAYQSQHFTVCDCQLDFRTLEQIIVLIKGAIVLY